MASETTTTLLGACKEKGCKSALYATIDQVVEVDNFREARAPFIPYRVGGYARLWARCPNGHKCFELKVVTGKYSAKHKCDDRCMYAKGNTCTCSCGGINHGRGYAVEFQQKPEEATNEFLGEVGKHIRGTARVEGVRPIRNGSTLYTFRTESGSVVKWFVPAEHNPHFEQGADITFRAKVKAHEDDQWGKATVVIYLEEVE